MNTLDIKYIGDDFGGELCPEALKIVEQLHDPEAGPVSEMDLAAARSGNALSEFDIPLLEEVSISELKISMSGREVGVRCYMPQGDGPFPILVYAHGGCWTFCGLDSHDRLCRYFCETVGCVVLSVDYAMAPECPYPAGADDFTAVVKWCFSHADQVNGRSDLVAVAGDSAGGNLAAVAAQRLQHDTNGSLALQLLIYPICDVSQKTGGSMNRYAEGYFFTKEVLDWTAAGYTAGADEKEAGVSPACGETSVNLASALVILAECDILKDQGEVYAEKMASSGVDVECLIYRGVPHAFIAMAGTLNAGLAALSHSAEQLKEAFSPKTK